MSSRPSYSLPSSSQLWVEAAASLNGVCSRDLHISAAPPSARYRRFHCCPDTCLRYADGATGGPVQCFTITRSWLHLTRRSARRPGRGAAGTCLEAHPSSIPKPQRRSTVAPFMQLAVSSSSAVRPTAPPLQQRSPSEG